MKIDEVCVCAGTCLVTSAFEPLKRRDNNYLSATARTLLLIFQFVITSVGLSGLLAARRASAPLPLLLIQIGKLSLQIDNPTSVVVWPKLLSMLLHSQTTASFQPFRELKHLLLKLLIRSQNSPRAVHVCFCIDCCLDHLL
jgi:hypothetical protein